MTQIKKTLSIAGIIAMVGAPAMADIASTAYVQNIVNNIIPTSGTVGDVLKKTANGVEWAAAPSVPENALSNNTTQNDAIAIGNSAAVTDEYGVAIGERAKAGYYSLAAGYNVSASGEGAVALGEFSQAAGSWSVAIGGGNAQGQSSTALGSATTRGNYSIGIGIDAEASGISSIAIGQEAFATSASSIQLGTGYNGIADTFKVFSTTLLNADGTIPAGRFTAYNVDEDGYYESDNNGTAGQLLQTNGDGTMSWVNALESILPTAPNNCKNSDGQQCALVMTWSSSQNKFTYSWEVVKVNQ